MHFSVPWHITITIWLWCDQPSITTNSRIWCNYAIFKIRMVKIEVRVRVLMRINDILKAKNFSLKKLTVHIRHTMHAFVQNVTFILIDFLLYNTEHK